LSDAGVSAQAARPVGPEPGGSVWWPLVAAVIAGAIAFGLLTLYTQRRVRSQLGAAA
jgi:hypothetical protein